MRELIQEKGRWNCVLSVCCLNVGPTCRCGSIAYSQDFFLLCIKDVSCEGSVSSEPLPAHRFPQAAIMLCHISNVFALSVHYHVSVGLLKAKEQIHHLNLPLHDKARVCEELCRRVLRPDDCPFIFGDMDGREKIVVGRICSGEGLRHRGRLWRFGLAARKLRRGILRAGRGIGRSAS